MSTYQTEVSHYILKMGIIAWNLVSLVWNQENFWWQSIIEVSTRKSGLLCSSMIDRILIPIIFIKILRCFNSHEKSLYQYFIPWPVLTDICKVLNIVTQLEIEFLASNTCILLVLNPSLFFHHHPFLISLILKGWLKDSIFTRQYKMAHELLLSLLVNQKRTF